MQDILRQSKKKQPQAPSESMLAEALGFLEQQRTNQPTNLYIHEGL
jgi:hypothetical protein